MFCRLYHIAPDGQTKAICHFSNDELLLAYKRLLSDPADAEGTNVYEPIAEGIRSEWKRRKLWKGKLIEVEKRFKNLKRSIPKCPHCGKQTSMPFHTCKRSKVEKSTAPKSSKMLHIRGQKINFNKS